ncbi:hypothetical protein ID855_17330 [Xenorhabdus sp. ZM]|uniref:hypothetical protein n=1 Tax=Xenorhabdus szentirmaii TaxID=290112 RepID=UPI0019AC77E7|nr:hypothetical protein [Xenorhabdus sp. ZM]MBD2806425.1 hypothetical protein [Xenorhabdus sp. ZM]
MHKNTPLLCAGEAGEQSRAGGGENPFLGEIAKIENAPSPRPHEAKRGVWRVDQVGRRGGKKSEHRRLSGIIGGCPLLRKFLVDYGWPFSASSSA